MIDAAYRLFAERGADAPTIDDIVAAARVARGTFYNHFATRDDSLTAVADESGTSPITNRGAGNLLVDACLEAQLGRARALGTALLPGTTVMEIEPAPRHFMLHLSDAIMQVGAVLVSAEPWAPVLLGPPFDTLLKPTRQMMHWLPPTGEWDDDWGAGPSFIWPHGDAAEDFFYGFPTIDGASVKMAEDAYGPAVDPDRVNRVITDADRAGMVARHAGRRLAGVGAMASRAVTCLYTSTSNGAFLIDRHPTSERIHVVARWTVSRAAIPPRSTTSIEQQRRASRISRHDDDRPSCRRGDRIAFFSRP